MRIVQITIITLMLLAWPSSNGCSQEPRLSLPAIRQVWLDAKDAPVALGTGSWSMVPRREFNRTLEAAQKVTQAERRMPWLLTAKYDARIDGLQMLGIAQLLLHNPHEIAAWGLLSPWTMPLRRDAEAVDDMKPPAIRAFTERSLGLLTGPNGNQLHRVSWSIQGEERNDGRWFQLQLPACPQATMNVIVPLPYRLDWPSARQHLRGPFPVEGENARRWELQLGGEARQDVQLVLRTPQEQRQVSWSEARLDADFVVNGTEVLARYEFDVQRWHDRLRPLLLDLPEQLKIKSLSLRQLDTDVRLPIQMLSATSISIALPESVEQRATVVMEATWSVRRGERIVFHAPGFRSSISVKPTLRVVSMSAEPLVDWNWGDYIPQQLISQETSAEVLTLAPRLMMGSTSLTPPSARQVERTVDLAYQQDSWWYLGKRKQQLTVRCQCTTSQGLSEFMSWLVPSGWAVKEVTSDPSMPLQAWTWHPGRPLEVQWPAGRRSGQKCIITVQLEPISPGTITEEPRVWFMPNLIPQVPGRFSGSYAISLERTGELLPPSMVVIKSPGIRVSPPFSATSLWSPNTSVPDLYWQLQDPGATGSVQMQDWPATVRASLVTEILDSEQASSLRYRMKLQPLAGSVLRWPLTFASTQQDILWTSTTKKNGWTWKQQSPIAGQFTWPEPLDATVELESTLSWTAGTSVPLLTSPMPFDGRLKLGRFWKLPTDWTRHHQGVGQAEGDAVWSYEEKTSSPTIERLIPDRLELGSPRIDATIHGSVAESIYSATVPAHQETFKLTLPGDGEIISCEIDGKSQPTKNAITLSASLQPTRLQLKYRSHVHDGVLVSHWKPVAPVWNVETTPSPLFFVTPAPHRIALSGPFLSSEQSTVGNSMVWVSRQLIVVVTVLFMGLCWWLLRLRALWRRRVTAASVGILALACTCFSVVAQGERTSLVYILRGDAGKEDDERVMVPPSLWKQLQAVAKQTAAGASQGWWVSEVNTEGQLQAGRLRLTSKWSLSVSTEGSVDIPWPDSRPPEEVAINGQLVQPRLVSGPFGLQQWVIPVQRSGTHEMVVTWELPVKREGAMQSVEIKSSGAPCQKLTIKGVPEKVYLQGTTGAWQIKQQVGVETLTADTGLSRSLALHWPSTNAFPPEVIVDVGVLWEHRVHQSMAHVVLAYQITMGTLDQLTIDLPAGLRVRSLSLVGEVQAAVTPRIRKWRIEQVEGKQQLQVYLHRPVSGTVHLLLEMFWQREANADTVPLEQVHPTGVKQRHSIVAYLADGVLAEPLSPLRLPTNEEIDFARPWLPSLGSLPASAIAKAAPSQSKVVQLQLKPLPSVPLLKTENSITVEPQGVMHRFTVDPKGQQRPLVYLSGHVDPGLVINEVVGKRVARWFQTPARPGEPSQLSIWFSTGSGLTQDTTFTVIARQPVELNEEQRIRLPVFQIKWDGTSQGATSLKLLSIRPEKIIAIQPSAALKGIPGPWNDRELIAAYELPQTLPVGKAILLQEENAQLLPKASAAWDNTQGEPRWVLTITAPGGGLLPAQIDMLSLNGQLEQNWQFEASVPLVFRPSRSLGSAILWSMQSSKPVNKVQIKCYPLRDAQGKILSPTVSFPAWPGITITPAE
ncbi:MAG TPA: hypothetical protein PLN21_09685 [Gemmatales bacterium]|nr:hypothetical protein [Gemmatales bacterium]